MRLPVPLEPWRDWLTLFAPDLAEALGPLLLRLHPLTGSLSSATLRADSEPAGVGNIVRRGRYERLLMTEWAYADAEPDEFIRRAAGGELLFVGPEPSVRKRSLRSVALFDAGLMQQGEPRLVHLALFILLARRAREAGALFQWGVVQQPGMLHDATGRAGMQLLLDARTLTAGDASGAAEWDAAIGGDVRDCWLIGATRVSAPARATALVAIRRALCADQLDVTLRLKGRVHALALPLPASAIGVRLLRSPFQAPIAKNQVRQRVGRPSLQQPPRFASAGSWLAVAQLNGGAITFHVPASTRAAPGKYRTLAPPAKGAILAAAPLKPQLSYIAASGTTLSFHNFPGPLFSRVPVSCERPPQQQFRAPPGLGHWLQAFYLLAPPNMPTRRECVVVLDIERQLVCWIAVTSNTRLSATDPAPSLAFRQLAQDVIGAVQFDNMLLYACAMPGNVTQIWRWRGADASAQRVFDLPRHGDKLLFGGGKAWKGGGTPGLVALRCSDTEWWVGVPDDASIIVIDDGAVVLGVAIGRANPHPGLVVLHPGRKRIELRVRGARYGLLTLTETIRQASVDPLTARIACVTDGSHAVLVYGLDEEQPYLHVVPPGEPHG